MAEKGSIYGITVLGSELFIVEGTSEVKVYNVKTFKLSRELLIHDSNNLVKVVACQHSKCLYVLDSEQQVIYSFDHRANKVIRKWTVMGECNGLSITKTYSVLVNSRKSKIIQEYTSDGRLIREIFIGGQGSNTDASIAAGDLIAGDLIAGVSTCASTDTFVDRSIENLRVGRIESIQHCMELSEDRFIVSHGIIGGNSGVCIIDTNGLVIHSYSGRPGTNVGQMFLPRVMTVDKHGYVMVADSGNHRVELLSPTLTHLGYLEIPEHKLHYPSVLHLDDLSHRLYIGESWSGRLFVLEGDISSTLDSHRSTQGMIGK